MMKLLKLEIKATYYIGVSGVAIEVKEFTRDGNFFYASTPNGVFKASKNNQFLSDFSSWTNESALPNAKFNSIVFFNNKLLRGSSSTSINNFVICVFNFQT